MYAVEMPFESIHVSGPEPTERSQPGIHLLERFRFDDVVFHIERGDLLDILDNPRT